MKLVTFDHEGTEHVGRLQGDTVVELAEPTMRAYFENGCAASETGLSVSARAGVVARSDSPEEILSHGRQLP